jgi:hypothetical protein
VEQRLLDFRYWFTDPGPPPGVVDERWYWSENHRLIFAACEYLAGQALPDATFPRAGLTGAQHRERAGRAILEWCDEKIRWGFSEWHSDAYYGKDLAPLVALAELADDPAMAERAATYADLVLFDLALHSIRDNNGSTHGRSYMRFKAKAPTQTVFSALKLCFDRTDEPWPLDDGDERELLPLNEGATFLARAQRYRPPDVIRRIARHPAEMVDREGMGVALDPGEPLSDHPQRDDGLSYTDPDMVSFWWDRGALTPWQLVPLAFETLERHQLWDSKLFTYFKNLRDAFGGDVAEIQRTAHGLHRMMNAGLLERVESYTWRNAHGMLSTAQGYRAGCAGYQHHISQATLDEHAVVFTTHPGGRPSKRKGDYLDHDRFWTGSATLPRAVQHRRVAFHVYAPGFPSVDEGVLRAFRYMDHTHAYFPTERFDEVVERERWTIGRRRDGYVALWSWRPAGWREHDPDEVFTNGLQERFELVAWGGPDNVWILEVGRRRAVGGLRRVLRRGGRRGGRGDRPRVGRRRRPRGLRRLVPLAGRGRAPAGSGRSARGGRSAPCHEWLPAVRQPVHLGGGRRLRGPHRRRRRRVRPRPRSRDARGGARSLTASVLRSASRDRCHPALLLARPGRAGRRGGRWT